MDKNRKGYPRKAQRPQRRQKIERVTGDALSYFILHNLISVFFFFVFTVGLELYNLEDITIADLFTSDFWVDFLEMLIFGVFLFSIISSGIGRVSAFLAMRAYYNYKDRKRKKTTKKIMKKWSELNKGINEFNLIVFLFTAFITSLIYTIGLISFLQDRIFNQDSLLTLIGMYIIFKVGVFFFVRWATKART